MPDKQAASLLSALANVLTGEAYYRITEPLWDRALKNLPFETFTRLLEKCRQTVRRESPFHLAAFYLHLLKQAIWKAPTEWIDKTYETISSMGVELEDRFGQELEFLDALRTYHASSREKIQDDEVLKRIDQMIQDYCGSNYRQGAETAAQVMDELGRSSYAMMRAFPNQETAHESNVLMLCHLITSDVQDLVGLEPKKASQRRLAQQASQTVRDLRDSVGPAIGKINRLQWVTRFIYVIFPALIPVILLWGSLTAGMLITTFVVSFGIAICVYRFVLMPSFLEKRMETKQQRIFQSVYNSVWRPRLFRYIQSTGTTLDTALVKLYESGRESDDLPWLEGVLSYCYGDGGLALYARSQLFVG